MNNGDRPPYLSVCNFNRFQHYHDRETMLWVKLYSATMHDKKVRGLTANGRLLWYEVLQLAGFYLNAIPNHVDAIARECDRRPAYVRRGLKELLDAGLLRESKRKPKSSDKARRKVTGWTMKRGSHAISYVPDPRGTDRLPKFYGKD